MAEGNQFIIEALSIAVEDPAQDPPKLTPVVEGSLDDHAVFSLTNPILDVPLGSQPSLLFNRVTGPRFGSIDTREPDPRPKVDVES